MSRAALPCAVLIILGFVAGRWLGGALNSAKLKPSQVALAESGHSSTEQSPVRSTPSFARVLELGRDRGGLEQDVELYDALRAMRAEDFRDGLPLWTEETRRLVLSDKTRGPAILDRWFELDPASAKEFAEKACTPTPGERGNSWQELRETIAASAARSDPKWALEHLLHETDFPMWGNPSTLVMYEVVKRDAALAKEWMTRTENSKLHGLLMPGYVGGIAESDPLAALDLALSEKGFERLNLIPSAVNAAASQGRGILLEALAKINDPGLRRNTALGALQVLARETNSDLFQFFDDTIGRENLGEFKRRQFAFYDLIESNPSNAARWAATLPPEHQPEMMSQVLEHWQRFDPKTAKEWIESQATSTSDPGEQGSTLADLKRCWTASELFDAGKTQEAIAALADARSGTPMIGTLAWNLSVEDPSATAQLALSLPECKARESIAGTVAANWTTRDPAAVAKWVEQLPSGPSRNAALSTMISAVTEINPESASQWIDLYTDPKRQAISIDQVFRNWTVRDPEAARKWLNSLTCVDERWKTKFLRRNP